MSANSTPLQGLLLLLTQLELVSAMTVAGTLYGIAFSLYCLYLHASLPQLRDHDRRRQTQFMITNSTIIMLCGLYYLISNAWVVQDAYIKHASFPGGPIVYEYYSAITQPTIKVGIVCQLVVDISTGAIQIWRLWIVWIGTAYVRFVVVLPVLCLLGFIGKSEPNVYADSKTQANVTLALRIRTTVLDMTVQAAALAGRDLKTELAEYALQATATLLPTILIAGFLIFESRRHKKLIGELQPPTQYMNVVAMLVESYVVESTWTILIVILYYLDSPILEFFTETQTYIAIIAYLLILYRVANGRAHESQRARESRSRSGNISSLHWNHTITQSGVANGTDTNTHPGENKPEPEILLVQGSPA
ncbi:hypothetical protein Agabi119p4_10385 [Agaricus bisporus var. burnettii]|uniref:Uncharacterized protein n=1 Tax=Agaricus bisporus var. burnettii TaxID=192524 RepID=A0A8H7EWE0_AGABI|nr:hypothetical protein Agabi119p4_10385 [Agaricus bisporus var. burnettii]